MMLYSLMMIQTLMNIDSDIVTFFNDGMGLNNIDLNNINLDDDDFSNDDIDVC